MFWCIQVIFVVAFNGFDGFKHEIVLVKHHDIFQRNFDLISDDIELLDYNTELWFSYWKQNICNFISSTP